jgi:hypothetical protein
MLSFVREVLAEVMRDFAMIAYKARQNLKLKPGKP